MIEFKTFQKIARLSRHCVVTEKIDGTNAQIHITEDGQFLVGSRNRYLTKETDNHGFHRWAIENKEELLTLGVGRHYGEWWGNGIQGRYSIKEKRFSLFNVERYKDGNRPKCCHIVPVLSEINILDTVIIDDILRDISVSGSIASGFKEDRPEGIVIFHSQSNYLFKKTLDNDELPKGKN